MKHVLLFLLLTGFSHVSHATLRYNNTQYLLTGGGNWPANGLFDIDGDGVMDIQLRPSVTYTPTTVTLESFGNAQQSNVFTITTSGQAIGPATTYLSAGEHHLGSVVTGSNCMISPPSGCYQPGYPNVYTNYIGIQFYINGEIHYGWIELLLGSGPLGHTEENWRGITGIAYDDEANKPVTTGTIVTASTDQVSELLAIYPNPVKDQLYIMNNHNIDEVKIYATDGQMLYTAGQTNELTLNIPVQTWPKGIYCLILKSGAKTERKRIVKE